MSQAITGKEDTLLRYLQESIAKSRRIRFNVAFLLESGVKVLGPSLKDAVGRGITIQILTGRYMTITEPSALYYLIDLLGDGLDIRFYNDNLRSFHPKAYFFDYENESEVFVGSSNLSLSALTSGVEWNYRLLKSQNPEAYCKFSETFDNLFQKSSDIITPEVLKEYTSSWKKPSFIKLEDSLIEDLELDKPEPRGAQIEALFELRQARQEGVSKGLVVAATGVGKTFLAAFDSRDFKRILFVAHREEILQQAEKTFVAVNPRLKTGFYIGAQKDTDVDVLFATIQTLGKPDSLANFPEDYFDYVVIDEFHHAAANSYGTVLEYFKPKFLLGLTATPYRTDNRDIFSLCDDNVIYEIYLKDAINRDLLVPFRYYGIYDNTDYDQVDYRNGRYDLEDLELQLSRRERADLILSHYRKFVGNRTLGFCVSIKHAEYMAEYFTNNGILSVAVHSGKSDSKYFMDRKLAIKGLNEGSVKVVFAVDIFNEGIDIPGIDMVMFLRPTESFVVYLQQLGRGLRKHPDKTHLTVLDFIGNYKRAHYIPALLAGDNPMNPRQLKGRNPVDYEFPDGCNIQFDFKLLDLFAELAKADPLKKRMQEDYFRLKLELERRPSRVDVLEGSDIPSREYLKQGWLRFLQEVDDLSPEEEQWLEGPTEGFLKDLEKTSMTKSYKLPTLLSLIDGNNLQAEVSLQRIGEVFMSFYVDNTVHQRDLEDKSNRNWRTWGLAQFTSLAKRNPVKYLSNGKYYNFDEINKVFSLAPEVKDNLGSTLTEHFLDILEYKRILYFRRIYKGERD